MKVLQSRWFIVLAVILASFGGKNLYRYFGERAIHGTTPPAEVVTQTQKSLKSQPSDGRTYLSEKLLHSGWSKASVDSFVERDQEHINGQYEVFGRQQIDKDFGNFWRLRATEYQPYLKKFPELATLMVSVLEVDEEGVRNIIKTLDNDSQRYTCMMTLYQMNHNPVDVAHIAKVFQNDEWRNEMLTLMIHDISYMEMVTYFNAMYRIFQESREAGEVYQKWFFGICDQLRQNEMDSTDAEVNRIYLKILSNEIQDRLVKDVDFRKKFDTVWEDFKKVAEYMRKKHTTPEDKLNWIQRLVFGNVLEFLYEYRNEGGVKLYQNYGQPAAEILLCGQYSTNLKARKKLLELMSKDNEEWRNAIMFSGIHEAEMNGFVDLLNRNLDDRIYYSMLDQLGIARHLGAESTKSPSEYVAYWNRLSNSALADEFAPDRCSVVEWIPGYDVVCLTSKAFSGRDITTLDVGLAAIDGVFTTFNLATLGTGVVVTKTLGAGIKSGAEVVVKTGAKKTVKKLVTKQLKTGVEKVSEKFHNIYKKISKGVKKLTPSTCLDITDFVEFVYKKSGIGRENFKNLTGLEARMFMRHDRKVFVVFQKLPKENAQKLTCSLMTDFATAAGVVTLLNTDLGRAGARKMEEGIQYTRENLPPAISATGEVVNEALVEVYWKKSISLWWLLNQNQNMLTKQ